MRDETVASLGEQAVIARIAARVTPSSSSVIHGIGDDAAVVEPERGALSVVTTDALVEGVHFDHSSTPMTAVGHRAMAVSLSDLAAMGATPHHALLSLALPSDLQVSGLDAMIDGLLAVAAQHHTVLVGGNITRSTGPLFVGVTAVGSVKRRRVLTRSGARPGDDLYVSGDVGGAAAGLASLSSDAAPGSPADILLACRERYWHPRTTGATRDAARTVPDGPGLYRSQRWTGRWHQTIVIGGRGRRDHRRVRSFRLRHVPARGSRRTEPTPVHASLVGGEDYELLFAVRPNTRRRLQGALRRSGRITVTRIGQITSDTSLVVVRDGKRGTMPSGYEHFGNR